MALDDAPPPIPAAFHRWGMALEAHDVSLEHVLYLLNRAAVVDTIAARVVHDLRNPLQVITMAASALADDRPDGTKSARLAQAISAAADKLETAIAQLMVAPPPTPGGGGGGGGGDAPEPIALRELVTSTVGVIDNMSTPHGALVTVDVPVSLPAVKANEAHVRHALLNLILNAREALEDREGGSVKIGAKALDQYVELSVEDDGPGIPYDLADDIFEPFFTTKAADRHLGLGLPVASQLVARQGGTLTLVSRTGAGALFTLSLPMLGAPRTAS